MEIALLVLLGAGLASANGANDGFKGVATLLGSGTASYRRALSWAAVTTALGSATAVWVARELLVAFSGKGLVPAVVAGTPGFAIAVTFAAGATVWLATRLALPVSTTHALIGALAGAGWMASPSGVDGIRLAQSFLAPLLASPLLAIALASGTYRPLHALRRRLGVDQETCVCVGNEIVATLPGSVGSSRALRAVALPSVAVGSEATCRVQYRGTLLGVRVRTVLDAAHFLSAGLVSFARGLNDTPKMAALLLVGSAVPPAAGIAIVGGAMLFGILWRTRGVAHTLAHRITEMNPGQGAVANAVTAFLVVGASHLGAPVSTTHVSCGALFGIGATTGGAHGATIRRILGAWVLTLPLGALLGAAAIAARRAFV